MKPLHHLFPLCLKSCITGISPSQKAPKNAWNSVGLLFVFVLLHLASGCTTDQLANPLDEKLKTALQNLAPEGSLDYWTMPQTYDLAAIPQDPNNPLLQVKVELGKMLFFEPGIGLDAVHSDGMQTYSCASCHLPECGFTPGRIQGIADGGLYYGEQGEGRAKNPHYEEEELDAQGLRPLSVLNVAYVTNSTWNGRFGAGGVNTGTEYAWEGPLEVNFLGFSGLECQNIEGLKLHRMIINKEVTDSLGYTPLFDAAFPEFPPEERYTLMTGSFAISAYLRTLLTNQAPFQRWLRGDLEAMNEQEKRGALVFFGKALCYRCHKGPALNAVEFYALGVKDLYEKEGAFFTGPDDPQNLGRGSFTGKAEDMYKFKVPQLYNLKHYTHFFHGSSHTSLEDVVEFFDKGEPENPNVPEEQLALQLHPLYLTEEEKADLTAFLKTGLYDPTVTERYKPTAVMSGLCFPNNDPVSRIQLGCE